jgi:hypothetical protein
MLEAFGACELPLVARLIRADSDEAARRAASRAPYPHRLYHLSGPAPVTITDLRRPDLPRGKPLSQ